MNDVPEALVAFRSREMRTPVAGEFSRPLAALQERFGASLLAVLLYGSCRRRADPLDGVIDLYVIVSRYSEAHDGWLPGVANAVLPPNVYYLECTGGAAPVRVKYAVLSLGHFLALGAGAFHSYFWARFSQPVSLLQVRDESTAQAVARGLAAASLRFLAEAAPLLPAGEHDGPEVWTTGFRQTYAAELRPESGDRARELAHEERAFLAQVLQLAAPSLPLLVRGQRGGFISHARPATRLLFGWRWGMRRILGVVLSLLRLAKAAFTFSGGVDYAAWKVERHTGVRIEVTPRLRRFPLLFGWRVVWMLVRRGVLK